MKSVNLHMPVMMAAGDFPTLCFGNIGRWLLMTRWHMERCFEEMRCSLSVALGNMTDERDLRQEFEMLISKHASLISRICFSYASDSDDFQDLRQDVLINIWKGIASFRGDSSSLTWIYRVALNTCVSTVRKRSRRPATECLDTIPLNIPEEREEEGLRERFETLHRLISELSSIDKAIVTMWLDERSYDEIAEVVGMSRNNIGLRLHRIRERWRKQSKIS